MRFLAALSFAFVTPALAFAQASGEIGGSTVGAYLRSIIGFINSTLVPFIFAIAFIVFIWGIFQYFIAGGANEEQRDKGKQLAIWGIIAFVVMISVWGIVNLLTNTLGFQDRQNVPLPSFNASGTNTNSNTNSDSNWNSNDGA